MFVSIHCKSSLFNAHTMILIVHIFMTVNKLCLNQHIFVAVRRILPTMFAKQKFAQLRTKKVRRMRRTMFAKQLLAQLRTGLTLQQRPPVSREVQAGTEMAEGGGLDLTLQVTTHRNHSALMMTALLMLQKLWGAKRKESQSRIVLTSIAPNREAKPAATRAVLPSVPL